MGKTKGTRGAGKHQEMSQGSTGASKKGMTSNSKHQSTGGRGDGGTHKKGRIADTASHNGTPIQESQHTNSSSDSSGLSGAHGGGHTPNGIGPPKLLFATPVATGDRRAVNGGSLPSTNTPSSRASELTGATDAWIECDKNNKTAQERQGDLQRFVRNTLFSHLKMITNDQMMFFDSAPHSFCPCDN